MTDFAYPAASYQHQNEPDFSLLAKIILAGIAILIFSWALARGIDISIENQDRMLCRSAKISGNEEWLKKCECFYKGEDITCIQNYGKN